jgi:hypothetical protein
MVEKNEKTKSLIRQRDEKRKLAIQKELEERSGKTLALHQEKLRIK